MPAFLAFRPFSSLASFSYSWSSDCSIRALEGTEVRVPRLTTDLNFLLACSDDVVVMIDCFFAPTGGLAFFPLFD